MRERTIKLTTKTYYFALNYIQIQITGVDYAWLFKLDFEEDFPNLI